MGGAAASQSASTLRRWLNDVMARMQRGEVPLGASLLPLWLRNVVAVHAAILRGQHGGQALAVAMYVEAGIRPVEIGQAVFGQPMANGSPEAPAALDLMRLTIPRRVYTQSHIDYVAEALAYIAGQREQIRGLRIVWQAPVLRHFTARFEVV